jgi:thiol-disulfide isomerase/thioredoxin
MKKAMMFATTKQSGASKPLWFRCLLFTGVMLLAACSENPTSGEAAMRHMLGQDISAVVVQTLDGEAYALNDPLRDKNKPIVINIWATWCAPCLTEMPSLDALGRSGRASVLAISTDASATVVKDFLRTQNWGSGMMVLHDPYGRITREALAAQAIPTSVVVNPSLTVIYALAGPRDWENWQPK